MNWTFDAEELLALWQGGARSWREQARVKRPAVGLLRNRPPGDIGLAEVSAALAVEMERYRQADRTYWYPIVEELKRLQRSRSLLPVGLSVAEARRLRGRRRG